MSTETLPEQIAVFMHETYERLAPSFGYETRPDTKKFDPLSPNGRLMIAVCAETYAVATGINNALRLALAASRDEAEKAKADTERLDAIPHGWRIGCEEGASGHPDHWYVWTHDWSQPLGEGPTLRDAIDAARADAARKEQPAKAHGCEVGE